MKMLLPILFTVFAILTPSLAYPFPNPDKNCVKYGRDYVGDDIKWIDNIDSWQKCGEMCNAHHHGHDNTEPGCTFWTWVHPDSPSVPLRCHLKYGTGTIENDWQTISGAYDCPNPSCAILYDHTSFGGPSLVIQPGESLDCLFDQGWNDRASSLTVNAGCVLTVWEHCSWGGHSVVFSADDAATSHNNHMSSVKCVC